MGLQMQQQRELNFFPYDPLIIEIYLLKLHFQRAENAKMCVPNLTDSENSS